MSIREKAAQDTAGDRHIICFVALPFGDKETFRYDCVLLPALRKVLELKPYYWQVSSAADETFHQFIYDNVGEWLKRAHVYIADISDLNYNVMMEFGFMLWARKPDQPLVVLDRTGAKQQLADIQGLIRTPYSLDDYPLTNDRQIGHAVEDLAQYLRRCLGGITAVQTLNREQNLNGAPRQHFLSAFWIQEKCSLDPKTADAVSKGYTTMEAIETAQPEDIIETMSNQNLYLNLFSAQSIQNAVIAELQQIRKRNSR